MKTKIFIAFFLSVSMLCAQSSGALSRPGIFKKRQAPDITVEGFKWKSGGMGRRAVFHQITLKNNNKSDYSDIVLKARFFSRDQKRLGSVRGTLRRKLKAGETKTFADVRLGIMNFNMDSVSIEVVGAYTETDGGKTHPLEVTDWQWRGGGYGGGGGTVASVTVKNSSSKPHAVEFLIVQKKAGAGILSHAVKMKKIAEANSETVFKNINPAFVHPDTDSIEVTIRSAHPLSKKQTALLTGGKDKNRGTENGFESAVPGYDIEVEEFEWGSGVAGSLGKIKSLTLTNISGIHYEEIFMLAEFFSRDGNSVLTSNGFKIKNPPPSGKTVVFKNLIVGILNVSPDKDLVRIYVKGGKPAPLEK